MQWGHTFPLITQKFNFESSIHQILLSECGRLIYSNIAFITKSLQMCWWKNVIVLVSFNLKNYFSVKKAKKEPKSQLNFLGQPTKKGQSGNPDQWCSRDSNLRDRNLLKSRHRGRKISHIRWNVCRIFQEMSSSLPQWRAKGGQTERRLRASKAGVHPKNEITKIKFH